MTNHVHVRNENIVSLRMAVLVLCVLFFAITTPKTLLANGDWSSLDINEHLMGATNVHAIAGNGGLSVGLSKFGEITLLNWPSPSYTDQLAYITSNHPDARKWPHFGAKESMGAFFGLRYRESGQERFTWLRGEEWTSSIVYKAPDAPVPQTILTNDTLGIEVVITDFVLPDADVLVRHLEINIDESAAITPLSVVSYANLSPTLTRIPKLPIADWALDTINDFAAIYDKKHDAIIHFRPENAGKIESIIDLVLLPYIDFGVIGNLLKNKNVDAETVFTLAGELDNNYGSGVYIAFSGGQFKADRKIQIGFDSTDICGSIDELGDNILLIPERFPESDPMDLSALDMLRCSEPALDAIIDEEGWNYVAKDAYLDAADGMSGSPIAAGQVNSAIELALVPSNNGYQSVSIFAFGKTASKAVDNLQYARNTNVEDHLNATLESWKERIAPLRLPNTDDENILAFCKRTLVNLLVGTDKNSKAIVASLSRQPAYGEDWPRDGAFFNAALDVAGLHDLVTERMMLYSKWQRKEADEPEALIDPEPPTDPDNPDSSSFPPGAWEMNYYADGMIGGFIRYEIDNTALLLWNYAYHAGYIDNEEHRRVYLENIWDTVKSAADLLTRWKDYETGLHAEANENDNPAYTQTLFGAGPVFVALTSAARIARALENENDALRYEARAEELREAIFKHLVDPETGYLLERRNISGHPGSNLHAASSTAIWPGRLMPFGDSKTNKQMVHNMEEILSVLRGDLGGGSYLNKVTVAAALSLRGHEAHAKIGEALQYLTYDLPTENTLHYGEIFLYRDGDYDQRVANPHLWAATLTYLTAMAYFNPELFDRHLCVLPSVSVDTPYECESLIITDGDEEIDADEETEDDVDSNEASIEQPSESGSCQSLRSSYSWLYLSLVLLMMIFRQQRSKCKVCKSRK